MKLVFGIEGSGGYGYAFAAYLKSKGYTVKEVNAVLTDRQRLKSPHPDKSDPVGARAIAKVLVDRFEELPEAGSDEISKALKELVQHRRVLVQNRTALRHRLHSLLHQQHPNYREFFHEPFCKTAMAFWERFPSRHTCGALERSDWSNICGRTAIRIPARQRPEELLEAADKTRSNTFVQVQRDFIVCDLVCHLRSLDKQINGVVAHFEELLVQTGQTLTTMDGVDTVSAATILANVDIRRLTSAAKLARHAGVAPLENSSGQSRRKRNSKTGCRELHHGLYVIAVNQLRRNPLAQANYRDWGTPIGWPMRGIRWTLIHR